MEALARQRCFIHLQREAVARCTACSHSYCRECITEHDDRIICAACLRQLAAASVKPETVRWNPWPAAQLGLGLLSAWIVFYLAGQALVGLPEEFHNDTLWRARFEQLVGQGAGDE